MALLKTNWFVATLTCKLFVKFGFLRRKTNRTIQWQFFFILRVGVGQISSGKANVWRNRERVVLDLILRGAPNTHHKYSLHHRHHMHSNTQHNITQREDRERKKGREERESTCFTCFFFVCDGVGVVDLPQRVHLFHSSMQCADVVYHVKKCLKMQREAKNIDTLWKVEGFFREQREEEDRRDRREEGKMKGKMKGKMEEERR